MLQLCNCIFSFSCLILCNRLFISYTFWKFLLGGGGEGGWNTSTEQWWPWWFVQRDYHERLSVTFDLELDMHRIHQQYTYTCTKFCILFFSIKVGVIFLSIFLLDSLNPVKSIPLLFTVLSDDPHPCRCVVFCSFSPWRISFAQTFMCRNNFPSHNIKPSAPV